MFCQGCGYNLTGKENFCPSCGGNAHELVSPQKKEDFHFRIFLKDFSWRQYSYTRQTPIESEHGDLSKAQ